MRPPLQRITTHTLICTLPHTDLAAPLSNTHTSVHTSFCTLPHLDLAAPCGSSCLLPMGTGAQLCHVSES